MFSFAEVNLTLRYNIGWYTNEADLSRASEWQRMWNKWEKEKNAQVEFIHFNNNCDMRV